MGGENEAVVWGAWTDRLVVRQVAYISLAEINKLLDRTSNCDNVMTLGCDDESGNR